MKIRNFEITFEKEKERTNRTEYTISLYDGKENTYNIWLLTSRDRPNFPTRNRYEERRIKERLLDFSFHLGLGGNQENNAIVISSKTKLFRIDFGSI